MLLSSFQAFDFIKRHGGISSDSSYPYAGRQGRCHPSPVAATLDKYFTIRHGNERALKHAVACVGPVAAGIDSSLPSFQHYTGEVYDDPECSSTLLDHAVLIVGHGSEKGNDHWLVKNSWRTSWGSNGYMKIARNGRNQCGIASSATFPTVLSTPIFETVPAP